MKYIVVGTSHAGYEVVETLLKDQPNAEIHLYERGTTASFLSCGIQSYLENISPSLDSLHYANEVSFKEQNINIHVNSAITNIDPKEKTVTVEANGETHEESYDKLFLSPGGVPVELPIEGRDLDNVYYVRGREWAEKVKNRMKDAKQAVVVGAGYIGIEVAEAFVKAGIKTTVIDVFGRILNTYLDKELTGTLENHAQENGLNVVTNESVESLKGKNGEVTQVVTNKNTFDADTVVISAGVRPATHWLQGILDLNDDGTVATDRHQQTSDENIYAGGDATHVPYAPTGKPKTIALATNARRQGVVAAKNMQGETWKMPAVSGTSGLALFDYHFAATGLHETEIDNYDGKVGQKYVEELVHPKFIEDEEKVHMKILFDEDTHRILGGQIMSKLNVAESINALSVAISSEWTLEDLALADFFFQPEYNRPWNYLNVLAQQATNETFGSDQMLF